MEAVRTEQHVSPDGALTLLILTRGDAQVVGFAGLPWHGGSNDLLEALAASTDFEGTPEAAVAFFCDALLTDQVAIVLRKVDGAVVDAWPTLASDEALDDLVSDPEVEVRCWSGGTWAVPPQSGSEPVRSGV